jgi:hypothetical protein
MGIRLLTANRMHVFKHHSADVITICMLLLQQSSSHQSTVCRRFESFSGIMQGNSAGRVTVMEAQVRILLTVKRDSSVVEHYTCNVEEKHTAS